MIKVEHVTVWGFEHALRGMRNPMNSWDKSDSIVRKSYSEFEREFVVGENDLGLMQRLCNAGEPHRKYLRMIHIGMDIIAPDYWFKEFDTYRVGITENSTSTMHRLTSREITLDDFSLENMPISEAEQIVKYNEERRQRFLAERTETNWRALIQGLPMSYNYRRTVDMNYENVLNILYQRKGHKLSEWRTFREELLKLPLMRKLYDEQD